MSRYGNKVAFALRYHPDVKSEDLPLLDSKAKQRIKRAIEDRLMSAPHHYGEPLRKTLKGYWKLRVGDYRVVFRIEGSEILVLGICHRKNIYKKITTRLPQ
jgi:mRNA interferase RelE/StbE